MNFDAFVSTLPIMAKGMAGIFIVTVVIILVMVILTKLAPGKKK